MITRTIQKPARAARVGFLVVFVLFPVQMVYAFAADEPYPGLFQPSFAGAPLSRGLLHRTEPEVRLTFAGGETTDVPWQRVLPRTRLHSLVVFRAAFADQKVADEPATRRWLRSNFAKRYGRGEVTSMRVVWFDDTYSPWTRDRLTHTPGETVVVGSLDQ